MAYKFTEQGASRIIKTVRATERDQFHPKQYGFITEPQNTAQNFIPVKILTVDITSHPPKHTWVRVELGADGKWTERPEWEACSSGQIAESSLIHPGHLAIEPGTICLAHWSIDRGFLLADTDHIIAYKLLENMTAIDVATKAKAVDGNGTEYGPEILVYMDPFLKKQYGPALAGWYGYAQFSPKRNEGLELPLQQYNVIHQMRFATFIEWEVSSGLEECQTEANVAGYWDGEPPTAVEVKLPSCFSCDCYGGQQCGVACYCPDESTDVKQIYHIVLLDQLLNVAKLSECAEDACISGTPIKNLRIGDGLLYETLDCGNYGCLGKLSNEGIKVTARACEESTGASGDPVLELIFHAPLSASVETSCPASADIRLAEGLIEANGDSCISMAVIFEECKYKISAALNPTCIPTFDEGTCISLVPQEDGTIKINNTMTLEAGEGDDCIQITVTPGEGEEACVHTINATFDESCIEFPPAPKLIAGECIDLDEGIDETGATTYTINNDMLIKGGSGIKVTEADCTVTVALDPLAGPMTSVQILCDVDISLEITCVQSSGGEWSMVATPTITKSYATLSLPAEFVTGGCGSSGSTGGGGTVDPPDPPDEEEDPSGPVDISVTGLVCTQPNPHLEFTVNNMNGADSYNIEIEGTDVYQLVGPSFDHDEIEGQAYWGVIADHPTCGNTYTVTINSFDSEGAQIGEPETVTVTCTSDDEGECE